MEMQSVTSIQLSPEGEVNSGGIVMKFIKLVDRGNFGLFLIAKY